MFNRFDREYMDYKKDKPFIYVDEQLNKNRVNKKQKRKNILKKIALTTLNLGVIGIGGTVVYHYVKIGNNREVEQNKELEKFQQQTQIYKETGKLICDKLDSQLIDGMKISNYAVNNNNDGSISLMCVTSNEKGPIGVRFYDVNVVGDGSFEGTLDAVDNGKLTIVKTYKYNMEYLKVVLGYGDFVSTIKEELGQDWEVCDLFSGYYENYTSYENKNITWVVGGFLVLSNKKETKIFHCQWGAVAPFDFYNPDYTIDRCLTDEHSFKIIKCEEMSANFLKSFEIGKDINGFTIDKRSIDILDGEWSIVIEENLSF